MTQTVRDTLARLIGDSEHLAELRLSKPEVFEQTQLAYDALYLSVQPIDTATLHAFAARVAGWHGSARLYELHAEEAADEAELEADPKTLLLRDHLDILTATPALATKADIDRLTDAGITADEIVLVSQLAAYESYLNRAVQGFAALDGHTLDAVPAPTAQLRSAGREKDLSGITALGDPKPTEFTRDVLEWQPWVAPIAAEDLSEEQADSFAAKTTLNSPYFQLLARIPAVLKARSALDNAVFLPREGLPKAERELSAAVASRVNDCIYCASVHSRKSATLSKRPEDVDRVLAAPLERDEIWQPTSVAPLAEGLDIRWTAIVTAAAKLSLLKPDLHASDVAKLRELGLTTGELADLISSTAFFAWANRLMLTLGEATLPQPE